MPARTRPASARLRSVASAAALLAAFGLAGCATAAPSDPTPSAADDTDSSVPAGALVLDPTADYGDEYADGILPVGDGLWSLTDAEVGTVLLCREPNDQAGGAFQRGPWFVNGDTEYDIGLKVEVQGEVTWENSMSITVDDGIRTVSTNDLPDHATGEFPISPSDPAYDYDRNPNPISEQSLEYRLTADPEYGEPQCMGGESGVMLTGVALFNAFDATGRDAGAWETQDGCEGHPELTGEYHYHTLSSCIGAVGVDTVIGFALDGFPIAGPTVSAGNVLTTADLDECHGIVSDIELDGEVVTSYHYVMTQDFPYSVSCFRAEPIRVGGSGGAPAAGPPGAAGEVAHDH